MPSISILMSVYNAADYLAAALESILAQTFEDFEFIVIVDGSTDRSPDILKQFVAKDGRLRVLRQSNTGLTVALNRAAGMARAPLLTRMDPDDIALPTRLERQKAVMDERLDVSLLGSQVILIDPYGTRYEWPHHALEHQEIDRRLIAGEGWAVVHPAAMFRRDAFDLVGGYDKRYRTSQDWPSGGGWPTFPNRFFSTVSI